MNALLLSCYELGHQPLGLATAAAHLLAAGAAVQCLDLAVEPFDETRVEAADFVGISVPMHTALRLGVQAARRVRDRNPRCHICFYGLYASLNGDYLLRECADSLIGGEFEGPLASLAAALAGNAGGNRDGIWTREHRSEPFLGRQDHLVPNRGMLPPLEKYARLESEGQLKLVGYVEASRGCAHRCLHCPITPVYEGRLRIVPEDVVRADIRQLAAMGAEHLTFGDPDFLNGVKHSMRVVRTLHQDFPELTFDVTAKIEHLIEHRQLLEELRALGCVFVVSAVEALNDTILAHLEKGHTRADVVEALAITRGAGIALRMSLVSFTPWTSLEDYLDVLEFIEQHDLIYNVDPVQHAIRLLVPPGSRLLGTPQLTPHLGGLDQEHFSYRWTHPDPRMDALHLEVCKLIEAAVHADEDPFVTFCRVKHLALAARAGRPFAAAPLGPRGALDRPPRLTEAWFC
jgi:radical SAM superfamily enzyme YgiQ (UPF0313 family)